MMAAKGEAMKYLITFASATGNTQKLAQAVREALPVDECVNFGSTMMIAPHDVVEAKRAYVGFWTNRGTCPDAVAEILQSLAGKEIFLFGTAGFGESQDYFDGILARVKENVPKSARVIGTFMCQGKMPPSVRERYEAMLSNPNEEAKARFLIENFDRASSHPDEGDLADLKRTIERVR